MRYASALSSAFLLGSFCLYGAPSIVAPAITVGSNLETAATISFPQGVPAGGIDITLTSSDVGHLRFAKQQDQAGSASLVIHVREKFRESPEFWVQGLGEPGNISYTAKTSEDESTGTVTVTLSAVIVTGPFRAPKFNTTNRSNPSLLRFAAARLDAGGKFAEEQFVAGGLSVPVEILNSQPQVGTTTPAHLTISGGSNFVSGQFQPVAEGETTLLVKVPSGFHAPLEMAAVTAIVKMPALVVTDEQPVGQNLEVRGLIALGAAAPAGGVKVTLTSEDPSRLILSASESAAGSKSIIIVIPEGKPNGFYYMQALGNSGSVRYSASAPGYRSGSSTVYLTPSGVVLTPIFQGPPDEAQVLRKEPSDGNYSFSITLANKIATPDLVVWTAQLDPKTHRSADITVQPLRGGISLTIPLVNSNPAVGQVASQIKIVGGLDHFATPFKPLLPGRTEISVTTPKDFTESANSTKVTAIVNK